MSIADLYNISRAVRRDEARKQDLLPVSTSSQPSRLCNICYTQQARYNCPQCNIPYCSLACYRQEMHGSCSKAFSTAAVKKHVSPIDTMASEQDRDRVLDILTRMDTQDAERASQRKAEDSDDFNTEDEADENVDAPEFRVEDVEAASTEQLLAMLTPAQRARFERAVQSPEAASRLMKKLDRKATAAQQAQEPSAGHDKPTVPLSSPSSFIQQVSSSRSSDAVVLPGVEKEVSSRMPWQSIPWFEASQGCPAPMIKTPNIFDSVAQELRKILSVPAPIEAGVDLTFNLCTVLMAYSYLLRHFDLESLASVVLQRASTPSELNMHDTASTVDSRLKNGDRCTACRGNAAPSAIRRSGQQDLAAQIHQKIDALLPFLTQVSAPTRSSIGDSHSAPPPRQNKGQERNNVARTVFPSLHDALMWLLSHLSHELEVETSADQLQLQLLGDLGRLCQSSKIVSVAADDDKDLEPRFALSAKLHDTPHAFAASRHALVLNAIADLCVFFDHSKAKPGPSSTPDREARRASRQVQRKLCFYLARTVLDELDTHASSQSMLHSITQAQQRATRDINIAERLNKIAVANRLAEHGQNHNEASSSTVL